jgi:hypothetical protein
VPDVFWNAQFNLNRSIQTSPGVVPHAGRGSKPTRIPFGAKQYCGRAEFLALPADRLPDPLHQSAMFAVADNRSKPQLSRCFRQLDPGTATSK